MWAAITLTAALMFSMSWITEAVEYLKTGEGNEDSWRGIIACFLWGLFYYLS